MLRPLQNTPESEMLKEVARILLGTTGLTITRDDRDKLNAINLELYMREQELPDQILTIRRKR